MATGGSAIRWFQRELAGGTPLAELDPEAAATPAGADGLVILPYLLGEKTPLNDPLATGAIVGLGLGHTRGHLFRALLESFGHGVRHHLEVLAEHGIAPDPRARRQRRCLVAALEAGGRRRHRPRAGAARRPPRLRPRLGLRRRRRHGRVRRLERDRPLRRRSASRSRPHAGRAPSTRPLRASTAGSAGAVKPASVNVKHAPPPGASATRIVPPCSSTIARAIARPRPVPPAARLSSPRQKRSNTRSPAPGGRPDARVAHAHLHAVARADHDAAAGRRVADRIADEVREHAAELQRIAAAAQARRALALEPHLRAARVGGIQREAVVEQGLELDLRDVERHDAGVEAREVEQVVDEQRHALDLNLQRREMQRRDRRRRPRAPRRRRGGS